MAFVATQFSGKTSSNTSDDHDNKAIIRREKNIYEYGIKELKKIHELEIKRRFISNQLKLKSQCMGQGRIPPPENHSFYIFDAKVEITDNSAFRAAYNKIPGFSFGRNKSLDQPSENNKYYGYMRDKGRSDDQIQVELWDKDYNNPILDKKRHLFYHHLN
jgi:hypothetical protein